MVSIQTTTFVKTYVILAKQAPPYSQELEKMRDGEKSNRPNKRKREESESERRGMSRGDQAHAQVRQTGHMRNLMCVRKLNQANLKCNRKQETLYVLERGN